MITSPIRTSRRNATSRRVSLPPPIGGWNTRDDPAQMTPLDATHLVNFYPQINDVRVRRGFLEHGTSVGAGNVDTLIPFDDGSTQKLLATSPTNIYDVTSAGAGSSLAGSLTSGQWAYDMLGGVMGLVNGADAPRTFDGTTVGTMTVSGSGLTVANLIGIKVFKSRSYFWEDGSQDFWYSAVDTLGGALTKFTLSSITSGGGKLLFMDNWTVDGGDGVDDYAVFVMSTGEVLVYQGSDPGSTFALVGKYKIPTPLSSRAHCKIGSEIMVLTDSDVVYIPSSFARPSPPATKLKGALETAGPAYRANFGWQALYYGTRNMLICNVPVSTTQFEQYVMNMETGAPARFIEQNARSWAVFNDDLYFGTTDGRVMQADTGTNDDGENINADARQAWNDFGSPNKKKVEAFRTVFSGTTSFSAGAEIAYDFVNASVNRTTTTGGSGTAWGSPWGTPWSSATGIKDGWKLASGQGQAVSVQVSIAVEGERPAWYRTDLLLGQGLNI